MRATVPNAFETETLVVGVNALATMWLFAVPGPRLADELDSHGCQILAEEVGGGDACPTWLPFLLLLVKQV